MPRITAVDPAQVTGPAKELLHAVQAKLGWVPNLMRTLAQAPAALEAYLTLSSVLGKGQLEAGVREQIALVVAETNHCQYCASAHTAIGKMVGLSDAQVAGSRQGKAPEAKTQAALTLAQRLVTQQGNVTDQDLAQARAAGLSDGHILEIVANVALNIYTNYVNHVAETDVDFPKVELLKGHVTPCGCA